MADSVTKNCLSCDTAIIFYGANAETIKYCLNCLETQMKERQRMREQSFLDEVPE